MTLYPTSSVDKSLDSLIYYRDIPVVVDGYENEKFYEALLRETANIPGKTKKLDLKDKFNVLPIFLCPVIQSQFRNVFNMDLTDLDIEDEYLDLILKNEQGLGSWVLDLVQNAKTYFDAGNSTAYASDPRTAQILQSRKPNDELPFFYDLDDFTNRLRTRSGSWTNLTSRDITNVGYLTYFFSHYMKVFRHAIRLSEKAFKKNNPSKLIAAIVECATKSVLKLHSTFAPTRPEAINITVNSSEVADTKRIKKKGTAYAKDIEKYYQSYGVSIKISSDAEYKDGRYIFSVKLLPGTDRKLISRYAEDVKCLLELEVLSPDTTSGTIKLIVSDKPLNENSLTKILESTQFSESKMEIPYAVGYDIMGEMVIADVAKFPHLLVGGTTGMGKSSALHSLLVSIVYKQPADKVKLLLFDFGASDLKMFDGVPHMLQPTISTSEIERGRQCISWLKREMETRLKKKDLLDVRKFSIECKRWPSIVCVIDEFPAFIRQLTEGKENKNSHTVIEDMLARARKVKIHFIIAAQDTTKDGLGIKNTNLAAGIAFKCTNWQTSKVIIGETDATTLFGKGSMYFRCDQYEGLRKLQGSFMPPEKIMDMLDAMGFKCDSVEKKYDEVSAEILPDDTQSEIMPTAPACNSEENGDQLILVKIVKWILDSKKDKISNKQIKDNFEMGYDRANRFLQLLEDAEIISELKQGTKLPRLVHMDKAIEFLRNHGGNPVEGTARQATDVSAVQTVPQRKQKEEHTH